MNEALWLRRLALLAIAALIAIVIITFLASLYGMNLLGG